MAQRPEGRQLERLQKLEERLFSMKTELTEAFVEHDRSANEMMLVLRNVMQCLADDVKDNVQDTQAAIAAVSQKLDNVMSRIKGGKPLHPNANEPATKILAGAKKRVELHTGATAGLAETSLVDLVSNAIVEIEIKDAEADMDDESTAEVDEDLEDLDELDDVPATISTAPAPAETPSEGVQAA